jgi:hypothetical protein
VVDPDPDVDDPEVSSGAASPWPPIDPRGSSVTLGATVTFAGGVVTVVVLC